MGGLAISGIISRDEVHESGKHQACKYFSMHRKRVNMDLTQIYSFSLGGVAIFLFLYRLCHAIMTCFLPAVEHLVKSMTLPRPRGRAAWIRPKSWYRLSLFAVYLGTTLACNSIGVSTVAEASSRAAKICLANLILLLVCGQEIGAYLSGVSLDLFRSIHRSLGVMAVLQALVHGFLQIASTSVDLHDTSTTYGVAVRFLDTSPGETDLQWIRHWSYLRHLYYHLFLSQRGMNFLHSYITSAL